MQPLPAQRYHLVLLQVVPTGHTDAGTVQTRSTPTITRPSLDQPRAILTSPAAIFNQMTTNSVHCGNL